MTPVQSRIRSFELQFDYPMADRLKWDHDRCVRVGLQEQMGFRHSRDPSGVLSFIQVRDMQKHRHDTLLLAAKVPQVSQGPIQTGRGYFENVRTRDNVLYVQ